MPATQSVPKELLPVYDRPLLQYAIEEALDADIERFVFITHEDKPAIAHFIRKAFPDIDAHFVLQPEALGLGHAVLMARKAVLDGPFAVILPDDLIVASPGVVSQMCAAYDPIMTRHMVAAMEVALSDTHAYGIVDAQMPDLGTYALMNGVFEKPDAADAPSNLAIVGRYILDPTIFETLMTTGRGAGDEIQLTDAIATDLMRMGVSAFRFDGMRFDCGHHDGLLEAGNAMQDVAELSAQGAVA